VNLPRSTPFPFKKNVREFGRGKGGQSNRSFTFSLSGKKKGMPSRYGPAERKGMGGGIPAWHSKEGRGKNDPPIITYSRLLEGLAKKTRGPDIAAKSPRWGKTPC